MTCTCISCGRAFRAYGVAKDRCHGCRQQTRRAAWRDAQRRRRAQAPPTPRACVTCRADITTRPAQAVYCVPCAEAAERERDREQKRQCRAARRDAGVRDEAPRDLALEAKIAAHLADIRASRRFKVEDIVWARRVDPVAAEAQDLAGASLCLATEKRTHRERRAKRFAEAERRAVATQKGAA